MSRIEYTTVRAAIAAGRGGFHGCLPVRRYRAGTYRRALNGTTLSAAGAAHSAQRSHLFRVVVWE